MTPREWSEIVSWLRSRYPTLSWPSETLAAYFEDLRRHPAKTVREAADMFYRSGAKFPPTGAELVKLAGEVARHGREEPLALPDPSEVGPIAYRTARGWSSFVEAMQYDCRINNHRGDPPDGCRLCNPAETETESEEVSA